MTSGGELPRTAVPVHRDGTGALKLIVQQLPSRNGVPTSRASRDRNPDRNPGHPSMNTP